MDARRADPSEKYQVNGTVETEIAHDFTEFQGFLFLFAPLRRTGFGSVLLPDSFGHLSRKVGKFFALAVVGEWINYRLGRVWEDNQFEIFLLIFKVKKINFWQTAQEE
ncbi:MAG: hypothetical protein U0T81_11795 [Saprospiraceae bacterium]